MKVPFLDIKNINLRYKKEFTQLLHHTLEKGMYIQGELLQKFEKEYADFNGVKYCVGVGNGLDALTISLKALHIGKGDEVIVPANTYIASLLAITAAGAKPVLAEPRSNTYNIDPNWIEHKISSRTKAIMAVNLYGQAAELDTIRKICKQKNIFLVEDNAQSQGALCKGRLTGSYGIVNGTSFYPGKNLGALGDAGAITTNSKTLQVATMLFRNYGSPVKYVHTIKGTNSRLDELQAGFLSIKLKGLNNEIRKRQQIALQYAARLQQLDGLILPATAEHCTSVYHLFVIRTPYRDRLQQYLLKHGIGTMIHYPVPPHLQACYADLKLKKGQFPITEELASTCLSLPMYSLLKKNQVDLICDHIIKFFKP